MSPTTSRDLLGFVVPIPTLPAAFILNISSPPIFKLKLLPEFMAVSPVFICCKAYEMSEILSMFARRKVSTPPVVAFSNAPISFTSNFPRK